MAKILDRQEEEEKFERWLIVMDDKLEPLEEYAETKGFDLDYSLSSLDIFEDFLLSENIDINHDWFITCARYLGEVVRKNFNGSWDLALDDPRDMDYGKPVIVNFSKYDLQYSPIAMLKVFIIRKKKGLLKTQVIEHVNPTELDLSHLPDED